MVLWIIAGAFTVAASPFLLIARHVFKRDSATAKWPRAPGMITEARIEEGTSRSRDDEGYDHEYTVYTPIVRYTYTVNGQTFEGSRIGPADGSMDRGSARDTLNRYPPNSRVEVLYNGADPTTAYLEVKRSTGAMILFVWGCVFLLVAAILAFLALIL